MDQPAQALHVALARRGKDGARAEEEQALEYRMIEDVEQRRGRRQRGRPAHVVGSERQAQTQTDEDDADVLDGVIGEQALEIVLHQRVQDAQNRARAAEREAPRRPTTRWAAPSGRRRCARSRIPRPWS